VDTLYIEALHTEYSIRLLKLPNKSDLMKLHAEPINNVQKCYIYIIIRKVYEIIIVNIIFEYFSSYLLSIVLLFFPTFLFSLPSSVLLPPPQETI